MEAMQTDLNAILWCRFYVSTTSEQFKDIFEGYYCTQFSWLMWYYLLSLTRYLLALEPLIFTELPPFLVFPQLAQWRCDNIVTKSLLTLSQRCGTIENKSCADVSFWRCDNVPLQRCQGVSITLLQRRHNIKHWISRPFYYGLFWFLSPHQNVRELQKW